jgi:hypothetical protein
MAQWTDSERQLRLMMLALNDFMPGIVCLNSTCPTGEPVPHMANDSGPHPEPAGQAPYRWAELVRAQHDHEHDTLDRRRGRGLWAHR